MPFCILGANKLKPSGESQQPNVNKKCTKETTPNVLAASQVAMADSWLRSCECAVGVGARSASSSTRPSTKKNFQEGDAGDRSKLMIRSHGPIAGEDGLHHTNWPGSEGGHPTKSCGPGP